MKKMKRRNTSRMGEKKQIEELDKQWKALHKDIVERCFDGTENFEWSTISKLPLKVINILQPMTWRMRDAEEAARVLIDKDYIHPAAILIRSAMENAAFMHMLFITVKDVVDEKKVLDNTDEILMNLSFGNQYKKGEFISDDVFESMQEHKAYRTGKLMKEIEKLYPTYHSMYSALCEIVHTNTDGVQGCYSELDEENHVTYYGKMLTKENAIFPAIESSMVLALSIFKGYHDAIREMLPEFIVICEQDIENKK